VIDIDGVKELTTDRCQDFNRRAADAEAKNNVVYRTYLLQRTAARISAAAAGLENHHEREGDNDGLVSVNRRIGRQHRGR